MVDTLVNDPTSNIPGPTPLSTILTPPVGADGCTSVIESAVSTPIFILIRLPKNGVLVRISLALRTFTIGSVTLIPLMVERPSILPVGFPPVSKLIVSPLAGILIPELVRTLLNLISPLFKILISPSGGPWLNLYSRIFRFPELLTSSRWSILKSVPNSFLIRSVFIAPFIFIVIVLNCGLLTSLPLMVDRPDI